MRGERRGASSDVGIRKSPLQILIPELIRGQIGYKKLESHVENARSSKLLHKDAPLRDTSKTQVAFRITTNDFFTDVSGLGDAVVTRPTYSARCVLYNNTQRQSPNIHINVNINVICIFQLARFAAYLQHGQRCGRVSSSHQSQH